MYLSGQYNNFENRLHQLPTDTVDLNLFKIEGQSYTGILQTGIGVESTVSFENKWDKEFKKKAANFGVVTGNQFS